MSAAANILVIDDEASMRDSCQQSLAREGYRVKVAEDGIRGLSMLEAEAFHLIILDLKMPGLNGLDVLKRIRHYDPEAVVLVVTGYATVESAVEAMKAGAYHYIAKPFTPASLRALVTRALDRRQLALENVLLRGELKARFGPEIMVGRSAPMQRIEGLVQKVGPTDSTVLISGESGTGKELLARALHRCSHRRDKTFVAVDCGSLVETLFESELFGHVKGAFTGATTTQYGRFELADGGTLFFDEIGNIDLNIQTKLLRVLQEREITKVGSAQITKVDVRIVAATNRDLCRAVEEGRFREDLFYRLNVVPIRLPPLRERREDIPLLAAYFLKKYNAKRNKNLGTFSDQALHTLTAYDWPGNVRELENVIERAVVLTSSDTVESSDLLYCAPSVKPAFSTSDDTAAPQRLVDVEKTHIAKALVMFKGHRGKTATWLGIDRKTLRCKLKRYGLS